MVFLDANPITSKMDCSFESFCSFKEKKKMDKLFNIRCHFTDDQIE